MKIPCFFFFFPNCSSSPAASLPADTSSSNLPNSRISKLVSVELIVPTVTLVTAAATVVALVLYFRIRKRRSCDHDDEKTYGSDHSSTVVVALETPPSPNNKDSFECSSRLYDHPSSNPNPPHQPTIPTPPILVPIFNDKPPPENQENLENAKPKLKRLHWDKVRASCDRETVWDQLIKSSSFELNEEMMEALFILNPSNSNAMNRPTPRWACLLDRKRSQNIAISLRALNATIEEVCDALLEGNADMLGPEILESLSKMAPTEEEEQKLKEYKDNPPVKLGPAEQFLKTVLAIPFAFKRVDAMLYITNFDSEVDYLNRSFRILQAACEELRNSRMFLKLLEAVLKTGNRMNLGTSHGDAQAFKLDTLLKLIDVKSTDAKTTLLHFVVQEIIKSDTKCHKIGLQLLATITSELANVKKAAAIDLDVLNSDITKLSKGILDISQVIKLHDTILDGQRFSMSMNMFMETAEEEVIRIQVQETVVFSLVKEVTEYFHGNSAKEEAHPFRVFVVVRDFLNVLDRVCREVGSINDRIVIGSGYSSSSTTV